MDFNQTKNKYNSVLAELEEKRYRESDFFIEYLLKNIWKRHPELDSFTIRPAPRGCYVICESETASIAQPIYIDKLEKDLVEEPIKYPLFAEEVRQEIQEELDLAKKNRSVYAELDDAFKSIPFRHLQRKFGAFEKIRFSPNNTKVKPWVNM